jgi:hypothetical protein
MLLIFDENAGAPYRTEAGREEVRRTEVDVAGIARSVVDMMAVEAEARELRLSLTGADAPLEIESMAARSVRSW